MTTDFRALCAQLADELERYRPLAEVPDCLQRARAALAEPVAEGPTTADLRQVFDDQSGYIDDEQVMWAGDFYKAARTVLARWGNQFPDARKMVRAALAEPAPEVVGLTLQLPEHPPSNLDRREVAAWYHGHGCGWQAARTALAAEADGPAVQSREPASVIGEPSDEELLGIAADCFAPVMVHFARAVLARWGRSAPAPAEERQAAPVPVPVAERLPGPEDCDEMGQCWWFDAELWCLDIYDHEYTHWLPANALPLPQGEVEHD